MSQPLTKDGVLVKPGQHWEDLDKRMHGRVVEVISVDQYNGTWKALVMPDVGRYSKISISRMYVHSKGFKLIRP